MGFWAVADMHFDHATLVPTGKWAVFGTYWEDHEPEVQECCIDTRDEAEMIARDEYENN